MSNRIVAGRKFSVADKPSTGDVAWPIGFSLIILRCRATLSRKENFCCRWTVRGQCCLVRKLLKKSSSVPRHIVVGGKISVEGGPSAGNVAWFTNFLKKVLRCRATLSRAGNLLLPMNCPRAANLTSQILHLKSPSFGAVSHGMAHTGCISKCRGFHSL